MSSKHDKAFTILKPLLDSKRELHLSMIGVERLQGEIAYALEASTSSPAEPVQVPTKAERERMRLRAENCHTFPNAFPPYWPEVARDTDALLAALEVVEGERDQEKRNAAALEKEARHFAESSKFYHGLTDAIGAMFGQVAKTSDDGSVQQDVLALKVPELVTALLAERDALQAFKIWVHAWCDQHGVPKEFPDGPHTKEGCRIGDRMEWLWNMVWSTRKFDEAVRELRKERDELQGHMQQISAAKDAIGQPGGIDWLMCVVDRARAALAKGSEVVCPGCNGEGGWYSPDNGQWVTCKCEENIAALAKGKGAT